MPAKSLDELKSRVGESRQTIVDLRVEAGKVAEFARALRDGDPMYYDSDAAAARGFDAVPAPLTFTRIGLFPRYRADDVEDDTYRGFDLELDSRHVIHGEQEYEYERQLTAGDVLTGTTTLSDVFRRDGARGGEMTFFVFETEYVDANERLVLTERSTIIETDGAIAAGEDDD